MGPDFATNGEQTTTNSFAVYGERAQLVRNIFSTIYFSSIISIGLFLCVWMQGRIQDNQIKGAHKNLCPPALWWLLKKTHGFNARQPYDDVLPGLPPPPPMSECVPDHNCTVFHCHLSWAKPTHWVSTAPRLLHLLCLASHGTLSEPSTAPWSCGLLLKVPG